MCIIIVAKFCSISVETLFLCAFGFLEFIFGAVFKIAVLLKLFFGISGYTLFVFFYLYCR